MSSKIKHAQRSHKTFSNNHSEFVSFNRKALIKNDYKNMKKESAIEKVKAVLSKVFSRKQQDR